MTCSYSRHKKSETLKHCSMTRSDGNKMSGKIRACTPIAEVFVKGLF